jgi:phage terminase large subunit-like protein
VIGRRGGKSRVLALIAAYLSVFRDWTPYLSPGERAHVVVIAADRKQAQSIFRCLKASWRSHCLVI